MLGLSWYIKKSGDNGKILSTNLAISKRIFSRSCNMLCQDGR